MKLATRMSMAASVCAGMLLSASSAFAQEGDVKNAFADGLFKWINFGIVLAILIWVFGKKLPPIFHRNAESISSAITKAASTKAEAEATLRRAEKQLANLDKQLEQLRAEAQQESNAEAERIRSTTRSDQEKIVTAAKAEIEAAERAARNDLKELAARLAMDSAESQLTRELTPTAQETLFTGFVRSLDGRPN